MGKVITDQEKVLGQVGFCVGLVQCGFSNFGLGMRLDFRNVNTLWASVLVETLVQLGLQTAVICPGSRSGPLAVAFASHPQIAAIPVLDERSASFFALGLAQQAHRPIVLVCTSGTAAANFFPAIIEAAISHVPLLVLTADRPPELRDCHAGQAIDQLKLYGNYPNWQAELATPAAELPLLQYLRQTLVYAWERAVIPAAGPVHLNVPFRDPLAPVSDPIVEAQAADFPAHFFAGLATPSQPSQPGQPFEVDAAGHAWVPWPEWQTCEQGLILAGPAQPADPVRYCRAVATLSQVLGWPVLAEALSPLRNHIDLNPYLVSTYDLLLRQPQLAQQLAPKMVLQLGELPTSKELRQWLQRHQPQTWVVDPRLDNFDSLHGSTQSLRLSVETLATHLQTQQVRQLKPAPSAYLQQWCGAEAQVRQQIQSTFSDLDWLFEGKVAWMLSQHLPTGTPLFVANSMPIRDLEFFWQPGDKQIQPYFNRGANGIDGTLSSALGVAYKQQPTVLLTGDLALLHDTNGWLIQRHWQGSLTVIVLNNNGGGIFANLPIAAYDPPFQEYFATPQHIDFSKLCAIYGVEYECIQTWAQLQSRLVNFPTQGIRVLEVPCSAARDALWRQQNLAAFGCGVVLGIS
jgi:2-succinyl-5-enolpyruvyl-6-hydroxy-3-cyclohexene-1-carboxylate synthase